MNLQRHISLLLLITCAIAFSVAQAEMKSDTTDPQQHGTTMMHGSQSDEDDMSHTMHDSPAGDAMKNQASSENHAEHDMSEHAHHDMPMTKTSPSSSMSLERLQQLPASGKSREANYDGTSFMHTTSPEQSLEVRCALATRGLMMLDNESWKKCGGKPIGWSKGITSAQTDSDHSHHMNH